LITERTDDCTTETNEPLGKIALRDRIVSNRRRDPSIICQQYIKIEMDNSQVNGGLTDAREDILQHLNLKGLIKVCQTLPSFTSSKTRSRKDIYEFIRSLDDNCQESLFKEIQSNLANVSSQTCKRSWILKRKQEDAELEIRNVRARLEGIRSNMQSHSHSEHRK
jgi:hypothetical protein